MAVIFSEKIFAICELRMFQKVKYVIELSDLTAIYVYFFSKLRYFMVHESGAI